MRVERYTAGLRGEQAAEEYLTSRGMCCLERRYRASDGEVDLIMQDHDTIVFVEVKSRPDSRQGAGFAAITPAKQRRLTHAALCYLANTGRTDTPARFDVVEITAEGIRHLPNAFPARG